MTDTQYISNSYMRKVTIVVSAAIVQRFAKGEKPITALQLSQDYSLPVRLVNKITSQLHDINFLNYVELSNDNIGLSPATDISTLSVGTLLKSLDNAGDSDFIPYFSNIYKDVIKEVDNWYEHEWDNADKILIKDISLPSLPTITAEKTAINVNIEKKKEKK